MEIFGCTKEHKNEKYDNLTCFWQTYFVITDIVCSKKVSIWTCSYNQHIYFFFIFGKYQAVYNFSKLLKKNQHFV